MVTVLNTKALKGHGYFLKIVISNCAIRSNRLVIRSYGLVIRSLELENSFYRIAIRSIELDNPFSRIAIRSLKSLELQVIPSNNTFSNVSQLASDHLI